MGRSATASSAKLLGLGLVCWASVAVAQDTATGGCIAPRHADWMEGAPVLARRIAPTDCAVLMHTPPVFAWPYQGRGARYEVSVRHPSGAVKTEVSGRSSMIWPEPLPPAEYAWAVSVRAADGSVQRGAERRFRVGDGARVLHISDAKRLHDLAKSVARPRAFPSGAEGASLLGALTNERREGFQRLLARVTSRIAEPLAAEPAIRADRLADYDARSLAQLDIQRTVSALEQRLLETALAWRVTGRENIWQDLRRRALHLASWDPRGSSGLASQDQSTRSIAWALAIAFDWGHERFATAERAAILSVLRIRVNNLYEDVAGDPPRIAAMPYDSHRAHTLGRIAALSLILAGEAPESAEWVVNAVPAYLATLSPWGGEDGGYANGASYANWDIGESLLAWDVIRWTTGIDVAAMTWPQAFGRYLAYFLPPGTPAGAFGDGAEVARRAEWAHYGKLYAARLPGEVSAWYARQQFGEDTSTFPILIAPARPTGGAPLHAGIPDAAFFPSIGWAAMHSSLQDRARVSVYFKSSPYGSFNHSHADQNSFVVNAFGRALAIDSGYYDYYGSPHWKSWYKQTVAHNAITYDGGKGQSLGRNGLGDMAARGEIIEFRHTADYDVATGDATPAYAGALSKAVRSIVYLRPDTILVFDVLVSDTPRSWEWNIHALNRIESVGPGRIVLRNQDASLCVDLYSSRPVEFRQTDRFTQSPAMKQWVNQWRGAFATREKTTEQGFAAVLRVNCVDAPIEVIQLPDGGWEATALGRKFSFKKGRVAVK